MFNERFPEQLADVLKRPSTFHAERALFAPQLAYGRHQGPPSSDARQAAVIILLFRRGQEWRFPLTVRQQHLADHPGQVSLPGGALEPQEMPEAGALRELEEELGVPAREIQLIGRLTPLYLFNSNFHVFPWLGCIFKPPRLRPNPDEVSEVFELPIHALVNPRYRGRMKIERGGLCFFSPCINWSNHRVWGATAMILGELAAAMESIRRSAPPT